MKRFYLSALYLLFSFAKPLYSQEINLGPRLTALGNIGVAIVDVWSLQSNQAGITGLENPVASASYRNTFLNKDLSTQSAVMAYPIGRSVVGLSFQNYGFQAYNEQKVGFSYAKRFGKSVSASLNFNVHQVKIAQYGSAGAFSVEAGLLYKLGEKLIIGTHVSNPGRNGFDADVGAFIPVSLEFGASYKLSDKVLFNSGFVNTLDSDADFRCGLEYSVVSWLAFRGGVAADPFRQFAGFGYTLQDIKIDAAAASHPNLGFSPQIALSYEF